MIKYLPKYKVYYIKGDKPILSIASQMRLGFTVLVFECEQYLPIKLLGSDGKCRQTFFLVCLPTTIHRKKNENKRIRTLSG